MEPKEIIDTIDPDTIQCNVCKKYRQKPEYSFQKGTGHTFRRKVCNYCFRNEYGKRRCLHCRQIFTEKKLVNNGKTEGKCVICNMIL